MTRRVGNLIGGKENRCESRYTWYDFCVLLTRAADLGNGWASGTYYCQPHVVCFTALLFLRSLISIVRPGPPETLSGASPTYFVPWAVCIVILDF